MLHPWSHCRFTSLGVNLQEEEEEEEAATNKWVVCYRNPLTLRYLYKRQERALHHFQGCYPRLRLQNVFHVIRAPSIYCFFEGSLQCELLLLLQHASPSTSQVFCLDRIAPTYAIIHGHIAGVPSESGHVQSAALPLSLRHPCCLTPESGWKSTYLAVYFHRETKRGHGSITKAPA